MNNDSILCSDKQNVLDKLTCIQSSLLNSIILYQAITPQRS